MSAESLIPSAKGLLKSMSPSMGTVSFFDSKKLISISGKLSTLYARKSRSSCGANTEICCAVDIVASGKVAVRESYRIAYIAERNPFFQHRHHIEVEVVGEHGCKLIEHVCKGLFSRYREVVRRSAYHRRVVKHVVGEIESRDVIADCGFGDREIEVDQTDIEISQVQPDGNVCVGGACDVKSTFERKRCASFAECDADCNIVSIFHSSPM